MNQAPFMLGPNFHELNRLVANDAFELQVQIRNTLRLLRPQAAQGSTKARFGGPGDGLVMLDNLQHIGCALSVGRGGESWDAALKSRGVEVHRFDDKLRPVSSPEVGPKNLASLLEATGRSSDAPNSLLRLELGGDEWSILDSTDIDCLGDFDQIACTFTNFGYLGDLRWRQTCFKVLRKLSKCHAVVHIHADNRPGIANVANVLFPHVLQVTFANRALYTFEDSLELFPGPLDSPLDPVTPDIFLGRFEYDAAELIDLRPRDQWQERAHAATERKKRLLSFGPHAAGLLVDTEFGRLVVDAEDSSVGASLLATGNYAEHEYALAKSLVRPEGDVLIVGAHIGAHVVRLAADCRELIAVEANPRTFPLLEANVRLQNRSNVRLLHIAAGEKDGHIEFLVNRDNTGGSKRKPLQDQVFYNYDQPDLIEIPCKRLDDIPGINRDFDLVFMDIEGSEYFALMGMQSILARTRVLSIEFLVHHIRDVAAVDIMEFAQLITPHFKWLYIPEPAELIEESRISTKLAQMYAQGENKDCIYFFKELNHDWIRARGVTVPDSPSLG